MARWRHDKRGTVYEEVTRAPVRVIGSVSEGDILVGLRDECGVLWLAPEGELRDTQRAHAVLRAELQCAHPVAGGDVMVVYKGEDGKLWARGQTEFEDGRFTRLAG